MINAYYEDIVEEECLAPPLGSISVVVGCTVVDATVTMRRRRCAVFLFYLALILLSLFLGVMLAER